MSSHFLLLIPKTISIAFILSLSLLSCKNDESPSGPDLTDPSLFPRLIHVSDSMLEDDHIAGAAIRISNASGQLQYLYGWAVVDPPRGLEEDDVFAYRSVTKSFVATVILQLVDEGLVHLDSTLDTYVPDIPAGDEVTVRQMLSMRSGLPNYSAAPAFFDAFLADMTRDWTTQELLGFAFTLPQQFDPGTSYQYSNTNTLLLGEIIASVTGEHWFEEVTDRILIPLHLSSVRYTDNNPLPTDLIPGYYYDEGMYGAFPAVKTSALGAAGGLTGTLADLERWGKALVKGEMISTSLHHLRTSQAASTATDPMSPEYDLYGLGIGNLEGWWGHTGNGLGYQSLVMTDNASGTTITILVNSTNEDRDFPTHLFQRIVEELE